MNSNVFGFQSIISLAILLFLIIYTLYRNYKSKNYYNFWSPLTFISAIYLYYVVITPLFLLFEYGDVYYVGINMTSKASISWAAASLSLVSIHIGFRFYKGRKKKLWNWNFNDESLVKIGLLLFVISVSLYSSFRGFNINFLTVSSGDEFKNTALSWYFINAISFLVCTSLLFLPTLIKGKKMYLLIPIAITVFLYIVGGFRYRLVYLMISLMTGYYLFSQKKIKLLFWIPIFIAFFLFMGVMEVARNYARGLDLSKTQGMTYADFAENATNEARIFFFSGAVIDKTAKDRDFIYFEPAVTALSMPVPRAFFPAKPDGAYLNEMQDKIIGFRMGAAFLHYAEAYLAFGWIGVILNGLFIGMLSKFFWNNYLRNKENYGAIIALALFNGFLYVMISRGYLAQQMIFFFYYLILPLWLVKIFKSIVKSIV